MKILIFGGTTEGRTIANELSGDGHTVTVSVATDVGKEQDYAKSCTVRSGRLTEGEISDLCKGFDRVIDATHPYAVVVSDFIRKACSRAGVKLIRIVRESVETEESQGERMILVGSCQEAVSFLAKTEGNILVTTGSKELGLFGSLPPERIFARVLPTHEGIEACEKIGLPHRNILALQGPFSQEMNEATIRQYEIRYLVTKDGGVTGGFPEKVHAAIACGAVLVVIKRPEEQGLSIEECLQQFRV